MGHLFRVGFALVALVALIVAGCGQDRSREPGTQGGSRDTAQQGGTQQQTDDATILTKMRLSDSLEVASAQYGLTRASDQNVKTYLQMLVRDHSKSMKDVKDLARRLKLSASPSAEQESAQKAKDLMRQMKSWGKGKNFDTKFIQHAIDDHQKDLDEVKDMQDQTSNDAVKQLISKTIPVLQAHLDKAKAISERLGSAK